MYAVLMMHDMGALGELAWPNSDHICVSSKSPVHVFLCPSSPLTFYLLQPLWASLQHNCHVSYKYPSRTLLTSTITTTPLSGCVC